VAALNVAKFSKAMASSTSSTLASLLSLILAKASLILIKDSSNLGGSIERVIAETLLSDLNVLLDQSFSCFFVEQGFYILGKLINLDRVYIG
jgi:hypothetical protein